MRQAVTVVTRKKRVFSQKPIALQEESGSRRSGKLTLVAQSDTALSGRRKAAASTSTQAVLEEPPRALIGVDALSDDEACAYIFSHKTPWRLAKRTLQEQIEQQGLRPMFIAQALKPEAPETGWQRLNFFLNGPGKLWPNEVVIIARCLGVRPSRIIFSKYWELKSNPKSSE